MVRNFEISAIVTAIIVSICDSQFYEIAESAELL